MSSASPDADRGARHLDLAARRSDVGLEAEQAVLGVLMADGGALQRVNGLRADDFGRPDHVRIYTAIRDSLDDVGSADCVTVAERLRRNGATDELIGYCAAVSQSTPSSARIEHYAQLVREHAQRRELAALGAELATRAAAPGSDLDTLRREFTASIAAIRTPRERLACLDWRELATQAPPDRRWAIRGWIGFGHVSLLAGPGGIGKTLIAQQLASALALGRRFIDEVPGPLKSLLWCCEDDVDELWRRQVAIARWLDAPLESFAGTLHIQARHGLENALCGVELGRLLFSPLLHELREQAGDLGAELVVLDNVAQIYGANESDRHQVTAFLNQLVGALPGRAILLLAHPARSLGSEFSGSGAWEAVARTRLYLGDKLPDQKSGDDDPTSTDVRYLARRKANYSARDWRRFRYSDGVLLPDAIEDQGGIVGHLREQAAERTVIEGLKRLQAMGLNATDGSTSPRFLPRLLLDYKLAEGRTKRELADAMRGLMVAGKLRRAKVGTGSDRHPVYGLESSE